MQICFGPFSVAFSTWPSFVGSKSFHSSHDSATFSKVSGVLRVSPGVLNRILCGEAPPRDPTLYITVLHTICHRKGYPFCIPFVDKWYLFLHTYVLKVMLHETILAWQRCCDIVSNDYNIVPTLQLCVALKIVVANRPV